MMKNSIQRYPGESKWHGLLYLLPAFVVYALFTLIPIVETLRSSFFEWSDLGKTSRWIGLGNYLSLLKDASFLKAFSNNLIFIFFYSFIPIMLGLFLASLLSRKRIPGLTFFRTLLFLPQVISMVVVGVIWRWMFNPAFGPVNLFLSAVGLSHWQEAWLGSFEWALPAVGSIGTWVQYGFCMVLFLAGMQRIPEDYYEASSLDGANSVQQFFSITIPSLKAEIGVALITTIIAALRVFDLVYATTKGGPGESTLVTGYLIYRSAILNNQIGYGAAMAVMLSLVLLTLSQVIQKLMSGNEEEIG